MFQLSAAGQTDPAIAAVFARRGMIHSSRRIPLGGKWSVLGGIELNAFGSPDGLWLAVEVPSGGPQGFLPWTLTRTIPGINLPSVGVRRKDAEPSNRGQAQGPLMVQGQPLQFESIDFDNRFEVRTLDRRAAVMLIDQGMMQWLLDCDRTSFQMQGDKLTATVQGTGDPNSANADLELLFSFCDGFVTRLPELVRTGFATPHG